MQFNSYEDAAAEQQRLFSDSKKRVEERKEWERRDEQKVRANVNSNRFVGKEVSFNYPCNIGNKKVRRASGWGCRSDSHIADRKPQASSSSTTTNNILVVASPLLPPYLRLATPVPLYPPITGVTGLSSVALDCLRTAARYL